MDNALAETVASWRRHLHAHPELSLQEAETAAFVCARLAELGVSYESGVGGYGVVATLARGASNRSVGLRADMDALPINEESGVPHASTRSGLMHACGHDGHTAALLGAAAALSQDDDWSGTIQFVFQPAEEGFGGARAMLADGLLTRFPMERIFGWHNWPGLEEGLLAVREGPVMAGGARLEIVLHGHSGHAGLPHLTRDPMLGAGHLLVALQSIVARGIDPLDAAVVSICTVEGGVAANQIPERVTLRGTSRYVRDEVRDALDEQLRRVVDGVAATFGLRATLSIRHTVTPTVNSAEEAELAAAAASGAGLAVRRDVRPAMASEDFGWYLRERPGAFAWIGAGSRPGLHTPNYDFNDAILPAASDWLVAVAKQALQG
jgi:hippurate hydrolase